MQDQIAQAIVTEKPNIKWEDVAGLEVAKEEFMARYKLTEAETEGLDCYDLFELVGRKRGFLISGGEINHQRTAEMLLEEFRSAKIGRISLERPNKI